MHISDGVLPVSVAVGGYAVSLGLTVWSARKTRNEDMPKLAVMTAAFFVASLIHVPFGPTSVHLIIPGLTGALLGPSAFLSIGLGLLLQSLLFQFGGLTALGVNALMMGGAGNRVWLGFPDLQGADPLASGFGRRGGRCRGNGSGRHHPGRFFDDRRGGLFRCGQDRSGGPCAGDYHRRGGECPDGRFFSEGQTGLVAASLETGPWITLPSSRCRCGNWPPW